MLEDEALTIGQNGGIELFATNDKGIATTNVDRQIMAEIAEAFGLGDEVGFAVDFDQDSRFTVVVKIRADVAFGNFATAALSGFGEAFDLEQFRRFFDVAIAFDEGFFAIHHADACRFAKFFNHLSCNICH